MFQSPLPFKAAALMPAAVIQLAGIDGRLVRFVAVVIVPAVMFVVLATVAGNVAARNPVGCVYVAMRLLTVASRFEAVRPVTLPTAPVTLATLPVKFPVKVVVSPVVIVVAAFVPAMK